MNEPDLTKAKLLPKKLRLVYLFDASRPAKLSAEEFKKIDPDQTSSAAPMLRCDLAIVGSSGHQPTVLSQQLYKFTHEAGCVWIQKPNKELESELLKQGFKRLSQNLLQKEAGTTPEEYGKSYIDRWGSTDWLKNAGLAAGQILEHTPPSFSKQTSKILDVGCLNGYIMEALNHTGIKNLFGTDISYFLAVERQINPYFLPAITVGDFRENNYPSNYFDMVICMEVLEHIPPGLTHKFIGELGRVMSRNGRLLISTSEDWNADETHVNCRNRADWYWQFSRAGLVPIGQQVIFPGFNSFVLHHAKNPTETLAARLSSGLRLLKTGRLKHPEIKK